MRRFIYFTPKIWITLNGSNPATPTNIYLNRKVYEAYFCINAGNQAGNKAPIG